MTNQMNIIIPSGVTQAAIIESVAEVNISDLDATLETSKQKP